MQTIDDSSAGAEVTQTSYLVAPPLTKADRKISASATFYLNKLADYANCTGGQLLEIGSRTGDLLIAARQRGFEVAYSKPTTTTVRAHLPGDPLEIVDLPAASFDVCVFSAELEQADDLAAVHRLLKPNGVLVLPVSRSFNQSRLQSLLFQAYFNRVLVESPRLPAWLTGSPTVVLARRQEIGPRRKLSVVMPVFNERNTFSEVLDLLIAKEIAGLDIEIIVVESNSTDGTREELLKYRQQPGVQLVLEEQPKGKGHAVRAGLKQATGDFVLIQDADLEYDMNDYEELLQPLRDSEVAFVLGSRHGFGGAMKMRQFTDQPAMALILNFGHVFFTTLLNLLYAQRLKDPFTMYKVFRRDCLFGLKFECNRFDFDYELVIKLLRKGYQPLEIPATYRSRSFKEGKKVSMLRDPLTWLKALARFRVQRLNLAQNAREANLAAAVLEGAKN